MFNMFHSEHKENKIVNKTQPNADNDHTHHTVKRRNQESRMQSDQCDHIIKNRYNNPINCPLKLTINGLNGQKENKNNKNKVQLDPLEPLGSLLNMNTKSGQYECNGIELKENSLKHHNNEEINSYLDDLNLFSKRL
eukprot:GHVR01164782.1.p1 GENE.GHVR01164782.1~~GHVR01164782.1.p1  ORF type:complete len:137 (-),score=5.05 GHVR01164782.1:5635-6045(-)